MKDSVKKQEMTKKKIPFEGHIDQWDGKHMYGWATYKIKRKVKIAVIADGYTIKTFSPNLFRKDLVDANLCLTGDSGFCIDLDICELRKQGLKKLELVELENGTQLVGSPLSINHSCFKGHIDSMNSNNISGWIYDEVYPRVNLVLDVYINDLLVANCKVNIERQDLKDAGIEFYQTGFSINIGQYIDQLKINHIVFKMQGTDTCVFDEIELLPNAAKVNALVKLQNLAKKAAFVNESDELHWLTKNIFPELIDQARANTFAQQPCNLKKQVVATLEEKTVDIIIPVYKGIEETINCINSIFDVSCNQEFNVIVINDCSPEPELTLKLRELEKQRAFTLIENKENLGFVGTVNRGMKNSKYNDVILLNSDTVVTDYWLDKIVDAAYSDITIGTVTPFSNNATICSYPSFCADNELPATIPLNELSAVFATVNRSAVVDLPTAHGFCMFIKRVALDEVGYFDEQKWGKGYAEENDFSLKANRLGWRNVMATDAFVHHLGAVSFAKSSEGFIATNLKKLNGIYPDYSLAVQSFIKADPVRPYRNNVALELMKREIEDIKVNGNEYSGSILFISLTIGGGTQVATDDLAKIHLANGKAVFMLTAPKKNLWQLRSQVDNAVIQYQWPEDKSILLENLNTLLVADVHYHHTIEFTKDVWDLPNELNVPYDVTLHDYHSICPRVNLIDDTESYCGEPKSEACNRCIKRNGVHASSLLSFGDLGGSIDTWRAYHFEKLKAARLVVTPSHDTKDRILKYFDLENIEARYHPEPELDYQPISLEGVDVINVVFIGAIGVHKGLNILKECAQYAYKFDLPIKFTVIGYTADDQYFDELPNVTITGKYKKEELPNLINKYECHVAGLFSVWPETYSYTLSEALRANLRIAAFELGAVKERCDIDFPNEIGEASSLILKKLLERN